MMRNQMSPPSYEDAVAELPTYFELLSMTPAQLEHQAKVERLEHERKMRAAELAQPAPRPSSSQPTATTNTLSSTLQPTESRHQTTTSNLHSTLTAISDTPIPVPTDPTTLSPNALKLRTLLRKIMRRDYASPTRPGQTINPLPFTWTARHTDAIYYSQSWHKSPQPAPPVLTTRTNRVRAAASELGIPYDVVEKLILQHHFLSRRRKFEQETHHGALYVNSDCVPRRDWDVLAVEMCRDAYQVIPIVAMGSEEAAELLEGVVKVATREKFFGAVEGCRELGFVQGVGARARWYRERGDRRSCRRRGRGRDSGDAGCGRVFRWRAVHHKD